VGNKEPDLVIKPNHAPPTINIRMDSGRKQKKSPAKISGLPDSERGKVSGRPWKVQGEKECCS